MKTRKFAATFAVVLAMAIAAHASPIFGTWKGELNGHQITVTATYKDKHTDLIMTSDGSEVAISSSKFMDAPPTTLRFQAANQAGKTKLVSTAASDLTLELHTTDGREATLRVMEQGKTLATVKLTKVAATKD
jgi:hypothetical protein